MCAPVLAGVVVLVGGALTPGYDPAQKTISRLAEPGLPAATAVGLVIFTVGVALLGLAVAAGPKALTGRILLAIAGAGLLLAAAVPLDPASGQATTIHRTATMIAMLALVAAPLAFAPALRRSESWRGYAPLSFALGALSMVMLLIGFAMLPTTFAVGAWERCLLALSMTWLVLVSARLLRTKNTDLISASPSENRSWPTSVSAEDKTIAPAAAASSSRS